MSYPRERKEAVLKKMLPPNNKTIPEISKEEGISEGTLYNWRKAARAEGRLMPDGDTTPAGWCAADKFAAVVETASMNETEVSAYCRERGLYAEQISEWRAPSVRIVVHPQLCDSNGNPEVATERNHGLSKRA